jgi:protein-tyrosine phosphatase
MKTELYWIDGPWSGRLAIVPRPRGGDWLEDEIGAWRQSGLDVVVSLLTPEEVADLDLAQEAELSRAKNIEFVAFPIPDRSTPLSRRATTELVKTLHARLAEGKNIGVHCRQGIGRSALIAACLLVFAGVEPETAFRHVSVARGSVVPETFAQRDWVIAFAQESPETSLTSRSV